ncbi:DUF5053 domain-containing protein [Bacteroides salyersiae]|jgi:citrate lyase synthetase|uniref:DUF5053 domain-containing protein n=1 Tax=Bacteroides salyersiae TaxID=291644 RepID=UPI001C8C6648|nr:DUF5053 domain-containing protein [Bacteroides salyersiae]
MGTDREIDKLLGEFLRLDTDEQRERFRSKMAYALSKKTEEEKDRFAKSIARKAQEAIDQSQALIDEHDFKQALKDIVPAITWSYVAEEYFNKSRSWFSQRMNGYHVNNKAVAFTNEEIDLLSDSLLDLSERIKKSALLLRKYRF